MLKDFFLNEVKEGINKAITANELGQMSTESEFSLMIEKPKNPEFGDFAVNVSSLARSAKIAPPMIANAIVQKNALAVAKKTRIALAKRIARAVVTAKNAIVQSVTVVVLAVTNASVVMV